MLSRRAHAQMDPSGKSKGPPPMVKKVLSLFGSGREEDRMVGYLSFLKVGISWNRVRSNGAASWCDGWVAASGTSLAARTSLATELCDRRTE